MMKNSYNGIEFYSNGNRHSNGTDGGVDEDVWTELISVALGGRFHCITGVCTEAIFSDVVMGCR